jgi:hypothetical protein
MPLVHIDTVHRHAPAGIPFALDGPDDDSDHPGFLVIVRGRLLAELGSETLVARCMGRTVASAAPAAPTGQGARPFTLFVNALEFDPRFRLGIFAQPEEGSPVALADIEGHRDLLHAARPSRFSPVLLHRVPPSGATWLALLLSSHPGLIAYRPYAFDPRQGTYWAEVLRALTRPASFFQTLAGDPRPPRWWLGDQPPRTEGGLPEPLVWEWLSGVGLQELADLCAGRIETFYGVVAKEQQRPDARLFVEKGGSPATTRILRELFPLLREVFVVRDPRDVVAARRGRRRDDDADDDETVVRGVAEEFKGLMHAAGVAGESGLIVRLEALVQDPAGVLATLLPALGLDASSDTVAGLVAFATRAREGLPRGQRNVRPADIQRFRRDLPPPLVAHCNTAFRDALDRFGYGL